MDSILTQCRSKDVILSILSLQFIMDVVTFLNLPIARQVIGFVYFTFVPGFVIIRLLRMDELDVLETILFSTGLSIAFLMLTGLILSAFGPSLGILKPLSLMPLMMLSNIFTLTGVLLTYLRSNRVQFENQKSLKLSPLVLMFAALPILSILGTIWVNIFESNIILLSMLILIPLLFSISVISRKTLPSKLYSFAILMIAISLLFHSSLISRNLISFGSDIPFELFMSEATKKDGQWSSVLIYSGDPGYSRLNSMLSITILPTIYSLLLNIDIVSVFKIIYPLIFALVPLALYRHWQKDWGKKRALSAAFLLMAQQTFFTEMLGLGRQMIGELFLLLLLLVVLNSKMRPPKKMILFVIFGCALVISHYALAEILLFFISFVLVALVLMKRPSRNITVSMVVLFFTIMFSWYIYTSSSAVFESFLSFGEYVFNQLDQFLNPASRGQTVLIGLGLEGVPSIWNATSRVFAYLTQFLIVVGFINLFISRKKIRIERERFMFCTIAVMFLAALILVPGLANTLNMTRFYHILLFFLAPLSILGAETLIKIVSKRKTEVWISILLVIVLVPYFLFQTGFVYEIAGSESWSLSLSKYRMEKYKLYRGFGYTDDWSVYGAQWLGKNVVVEHTQIYADRTSTYNVLTAYGHIYRGDVNILSNITQELGHGTLYLSPLNTIHGILVNDSYTRLRIGRMNKVYSNWGSDIYIDLVE